MSRTNYYNHRKTVDQTFEWFKHLGGFYYQPNYTNWPSNEEMGHQADPDLDELEPYKVEKLSDVKWLYCKQTEFMPQSNNYRWHSKEFWVRDANCFSLTNLTVKTLEKLAPIIPPTAPVDELLSEFEILPEIYEFEPIRAREEAGRFMKRLEEEWLPLYDDRKKEYDYLVTGNPIQTEDFVQRFYHYVFTQHLLPFNLQAEPSLQYNEQKSTLLIELNIPDQADLKIPIEILKNRSLKFASKTVQKTIIEKTFYSLIIRAGILASSYSSYAPFGLIVINVRQDWFDPATGAEETGIVASVQGEQSFFKTLNPSKLDPKACFDKLRGISSKSLKNLTPIKPIMEFDKSDARFIERKDVPLDNLQNIAAIPWEEFEHLVANIIEKQFANGGMEVKVTRSSREGGVDAVLFDPDPIKGGKYILQAKRYTNTVNPSAVRDLYATVINEGANRGILLTTSSFGPDSYEFCKDKPITLINGNELLGIFESHGEQYTIDLEQAKLINASL